jgi:hypothetical protein
MCVWLFHFATTGTAHEIRSGAYECAGKVRAQQGLALLRMRRVERG